MVEGGGVDEGERSDRREGELRAAGQNGECATAYASVRLAATFNIYTFALISIGFCFSLSSFPS
jgi:hypothetical protein